MLVVNNLSLKKGGGEQAILKGINCVIPKGAVTVFLGKSGAGKSSLLRCILQIEKKYTGEVLYENQSIKELNALKRIEYLSFINQSYGLFPHLSVLENCTQVLRVAKRLTYKVAEEKAFEVLEALEMKEYAYRYPQELSGGQKQRVAISRALAINAKFLVLDEPTSALDPYNSSLLVKILKKLTQIGKGIVISTQDMDFLEQVMDRVYFLNAGKIVGISEKNAFDRSSLNALYLS